MKVLFTGGGTMGSVTPLLAVVEALKDNDPNIDFYWIGTQNGPEQKVIKNYNIEFKSILAGKLRRYFSLHNLLDIAKIKIGLIQSLLILKKCKPDVIVSAGGFVAVPVVWAAWLLGIPSMIHQQDVRPGLANKLYAWCAKKITVCFKDSVQYFKQKKTQVVGNPVRAALKNNSEELKLKNDLPILLVTTGGRGSLFINQLIMDILAELVKFCQVIHITGKNKTDDTFEHQNYHNYEFLANNIPALKAADLIISRAGMATLTEIAYLSKASIIIPIPHSHQEDNAIYFYNNQAVEVLDQTELDEDKLLNKIKELLKNKKKMKELSNNVHNLIEWNAEETIANLILEL